MHLTEIRVIFSWHRGISFALHDLEGLFSVNSLEHRARLSCLQLIHQLIILLFVKCAKHRRSNLGIWILLPCQRFYLFLKLLDLACANDLPVNLS